MSTRAILVSGAIALTVALAACSSDSSVATSVPGAPNSGFTLTSGASPADWQSITPDDIARAGIEFDAGGYGMTLDQYQSAQQRAAAILSEQSFDTGFAPSRPAATAAPVVQTVVVKETRVSFPTATPAPRQSPGLFLPGTPTPAPTATPIGGPAGSASPDGEASLQSVPDRIIVRNVSMAAEVRDVPETILTIGRLASAAGGWVVSSSLPTDFQGFISIRVPAGNLDNALDQLRALTVRVKNETSSSQDFTEEFTDQSARLKTLQGTQDALRALFTRAEKIEDAILVQTELTRLQVEIDQISGWLNFISQGAAYSLVNINLESVSVALSVNAGADRTVAVSEPTQFRAQFQVPDGFKDFTITWDLGNGGSTFITRTSVIDGGRISAPVTVTYVDEKESPYVVTAKVRATGEAGIAEGEDTVTITVTDLPQVTLDAGPDRTTSTTASEQFRASFVAPEGYDEFRFEWDFGDGTFPNVVTRTAPRPEGGLISAPVSHQYADPEQSPYIVTVKMTGTGEKGVFEGEDKLTVTVSRIPVIEVYAGQNRFVTEGDDVKLSGSFTRPAGVTGLRYSWDFGDGSALTEGDLESDATSVTAQHIYGVYRPAPFIATLTVSGDTPAGTAESKSSIALFVREDPGYTADGADLGETSRSAVRTMSAIGNGLLVAGIWLGILSPIWLIIGAVIWFSLRRERERNRAIRMSGRPAPTPQPPAPPAAGNP